MSDQPAEIPVLEGQTVIDDVLDDDPCCEECWDWRTGKVGR